MRDRMPVYERLAHIGKWKNMEERLRVQQMISHFCPNAVYDHGVCVNVLPILVW